MSSLLLYFTSFQKALVNRKKDANSLSTLGDFLSSCSAHVKSDALATLSGSPFLHKIVCTQTHTRKSSAPFYLFKPPTYFSAKDKCREQRCRRNFLPIPPYVCTQTHTCTQRHYRTITDLVPAQSPQHEF